MSIDAALVAALTREWLGLPASDEAELAKTARRLAGVMAEVRGLDRWMVHEEEPAFSFDPGWPPMAPAPLPLPPGLASAAGRAGSVRESGGDFREWSAADLARAIAGWALSPVEVTRAFLERIAERDGALGAFVTIMADQALEQARRAEEALLDGGAEIGPLHGVPVALKDLYAVRGVPITAGSRLLAGQTSAHDDAVVRRLRAAGAVLIGKTATHEFAYGCTTDSPFHGPVRNPRDPSRTPGGSSGGSAVAVAAGMAPVALGTDTAGSVRIPAACCGIAGLKPTYGRVSKAGILPLSWSLDHPGVLARTVADAALVLGVVAEPGFGVPAPPGRLDSVRIGVPAAWLTRPMEPAVRAAFDAGLAQLRGLGASVTAVELPPLDLFHFVSRMLTLAEAGAYHAPYLHQVEGYSPDVRSRVELGQFIPARDYLLAQRLRTALCRQTAAVMAGVHALATPAMPIPAPLIGQRTWTYPGGETEAVADAMLRFASPFNVTGQPAVTLPCGAGPTTALQLVGAAGGEENLLAIAGALEKGRPDLSRG